MPERLVDEAAFRAALLAWFDENGRDLPWRGETDPYRIWVSEIMLQQTRTETVKLYYRRFLEALPDVFALAGADDEKLMKLWEGMGYYSRVRSLKKAAVRVVHEYGGKLPDTREELLKLEGIGAYASGAIASIAFGRTEPALDGNQARALSRLMDIEDEIRSPAALYDTAKTLMDRARPGDYNQALMGLGATVCLPKNPACGRCPVRAWCRAYALDRQKELPKLPQKPEKKSVRAAVALVVNGSSVLVIRRPQKGVLSGMWAFPTFEGALDAASVEEALGETGIRARFVREIGENEHVFTHIVWHMRGYLFEGSGDGFIPAEKLREIAMPAAYRPYRQYIEENFIKSFAL